ncbi:hypothetical protein EBZ38_13085 [bacterium]|nr:hypothetical protein [bacterium]
MPARGETHLATVGGAFATNNRTTSPTDAQYDALSTGISRMALRRRWGSARRAYDQSLLKINLYGGNAAPVPSTLTNQSGNEGTALNYTPSAYTDTTGTPLVYTATLSDGSALPAWITFNPTTRAFTGTRPAIAGGPGNNQTWTIRLTATDIYGLSGSATFVVTSVDI